MAKGHRRIKQLKSERAKVKLKAKKAKQLPKGLNVTDPSFKVKKIIIREQLKQHDESEIVSKRKLNVKDLLSRLQHHNSTVRQDAIRELKDLLLAHSSTLLSSQFGNLLQGICALTLDKERDIRRDCLKVLTLIVSPISSDQLDPYSDVLISYLRCAMTHIDPRIKEDSLMFLDVLMQNCGNILARNSHKILPNFLDMISRLHTEMKPGRQLATTLNSKHTNVKWRIKVLERLATMFNSVVNFLKSQQTVNSNSRTKVLRVDKTVRYVATYISSYFENYENNFSANYNSKDNTVETSFDAAELIKYIELLMPLIFDSWIEVCPDEKHTDNSALLISVEASELLKSIVEIIRLIIECIDVLHTGCDVNMKTWFKSNFQDIYVKTLLSKFPYSKLGVAGISSIRRGRRQGDFSVDEPHDVCLGYNLGLCQTYVWFTSVCSNDKTAATLNKHCCTFVNNYLISKIESWSNANNLVLPQLIRVLRTLFLRASKIWYKNHLDLSETLQSVVNACNNQSNKEMQLQLFSVISDIMLDHTLYELHGESAFKGFISTLPNLLLKRKIHDSTIQVINQIVLRYRDWIQEELVANHDNIIENAKKIEIIGSNDVKQSRLMICNLFYFLDTHIFY